MTRSDRTSVPTDDKRSGASERWLPRCWLVAGEPWRHKLLSARGRARFVGECLFWGQRRRFERVL